MSTIDLSRVATDPRKHYAGGRMQQGRVLTDDDFNDAASIDAEEMRRTRLHAIGVYGTPDGGFLPKNFGVVNGRCDFTLSNGHLYLGGMRLEMNSEDHFLLQKDWLNFDPAIEAPAAPPNGQTRTDLVWIEAWQQPITAVEDSELFEVALGGPDTTTRWRTMRRVHVASGVTQNECANAWAAVSAGFAALGTMNAEMELATTATLTVGFTAPPSTGDLCSPQLPGGYLGAENQAIRVQMVDATHYTWGYDNAAPLYRVLLSAKGGQLVKLKLLNQPKDAVHWPLKGQVVELLPWSAALANGERVARVAGHLCKVSVSYNSDDQTLEIDTPVPAAFGTQWQARSDRLDFFNGMAEQNFFFLRVWSRGDDITSPASIPIATPTLGHTGLQIAFGGGPLREADHWVIGARPAAPDVIVPWLLMSGAAPTGLKRYRAPIALLKWVTQANVTSATIIHDCRPPFLPLTRIRNCCSVTVGDGTDSFGMFTSINAAIAALPATGGCVCILPGRYVESVKMVGLHNVTLHGCGPRSRIVAAKTEGDDSTAIRIAKCIDVAIESLAIEGGTGSVIDVEASEVVRVATCLIQFRDERQKPSPWSALFIEGENVELEGNIIEVLPPKPTDLQRIFHETAEADRANIAVSARGGIQLAGGCTRVHIAGNVIVGGSGNGITLGSILSFDARSPNGKGLPDIEIDDPCAPCDPVDSGTPPNDGGSTVRYESGGDLYDITIADNVIARHGANGISVVRFFGASLSAGQAASLSLITVHGLRIADNAIIACMRRGVAQSASKIKLFLGYGGISLAFVTELDIEHNLIERNGRDWLSPVCGVFVLVVDGVRIEHNRIRANGLRNNEPVDQAMNGIRAGVHIYLALSLQTGTKAAVGNMSSVNVSPTRLRSGIGQLRVHANQIEQPFGRALFMLGAGPMLITDNRLISEGVGEPATDRIASTVIVGNTGVSKEWTLGLIAPMLYLIYFKLIYKGETTDAIEKLICAMAKLATQTPGLSTLLPTGKLMFDNNQASFLMQDAPSGFDVASVLLFSLDDVQACGNQFEYHTQARPVLGDLLAVGMSVRTNDNRLTETWGRCLRSIYSLGLMNTAADNQSTHCITALGLQRAMHHNLVLAQLFCKNACGDDKTLVGHTALGAQMVKKN